MLLTNCGCGHSTFLGFVNRFNKLTMDATYDSTNPYKSAPPDDRKKWAVIYPAYINSKKTQASGRKVPKSKAVDVPQVTEIRDVLVNKGFNVEIEAKQYPREHSRDHLHSGRVRVQLVNSEGKPFVSEYKTRKDVLFLVCEQIPKLKSRHSRGSEATGDSQGQSGASSKKKRKHK